MQHKANKAAPGEKLPSLPRPKARAKAAQVKSETKPQSSKSNAELRTPSADVLSRLAAIVGPEHAITDPTDQAPYLTEWRDRYRGRTPVVLQPSTTQQISDILKIASTERLAIVPQGGNTGLVGGQIPSTIGTEIVLSLSQLNRIRHVSEGAHLLTCEAGVTLQALQAAASDQNRLFPLSLASEGSCQIGGNLASNAGGTAVISYGNARELCAGLEVILADGRVLSDLNGLKKNNTGYDLKNLFIGSEGTLGIITAATMRTVPKPVSVATAFVACPSLEALAQLFSRCEAGLGGRLTTFEFLSQQAVEFITRHVEQSRFPVEANAPWFALLEVSLSAADTFQLEAGEGNPEPAQRSSLLEAVLNEAMAQSEISDAAVASSLAQRNHFWYLRECLSEIQKHEGGSIKHDISVPIERLPQFLSQADALIARLSPGARPVPFGHSGDGFWFQG
ncbi:MAG: FAD-binding oxidoreductase, partial [Pseudomonadota bacterium]